MLPIFVLMFIAFVAFAIFGFIVFVSKLGKVLFPSHSKDFKKETLKYQSKIREQTQDKGISNNLEHDVQRSCRLLEHLLFSKKISTKEYHRLRDFIDHQFFHLSLPKRILDESLATRPSANAQPSAMAPLADAKNRHASPLPKPDRFQIRSDVPTPLETDRKSVADEKDHSTATSNLIGASKSSQDSIQPVYQSGVGVANTDESKSVATPKAIREPWDIPDEPKPQPKRKLSEVLGSFMQERNIRWGELASGILIVGSAVGLVISLRNELNRTIPYFPALLFMLITAGIHLAGMYTLVKWKLRATSRGTLLIGLLLIPLNWLASCVISGGEGLRRPLSDPLYWLAISVGMIAFSAMTWWSSKLLFRKGNQWLTTGVMGAGAMTLFINRTETLDSVAGMNAWLALPLAAFFILATGLLGAPFASKNRWSARSLNRLYMMLGVALFATLAAISLIWVRSSQYELVQTAMGPLFVFLSVTLVWVGLISRTGMRERVGMRLGKSATDLRIHATVGNALIVLGVFATLFSIVYCSAGNPGVFVISNCVAAVYFCWLAIKQKTAWLFSPAWLGVGIATVTTVSQSNAVLQLNEMTGWQTLSQNLVSGEVGLAVMTVGALAIVIGWGMDQWMKNKISDVTVANHFSFLQIHFLCGSVAVGIGCCLALVAALVNPQSVFDTMTASILLGLATLGGLVGSATGKRRQWLSLAVCLSGLICLAFSFQLNPTLVQWLDTAVANGDAGVRWLFIFVMYSLLLTAASVAISAREICDKPALHTYFWFATGAIVSATTACFVLLPSAFPWLVPASGIMVGIAFVQLWAGRNLAPGSRLMGSMVAGGSTASLASLALLEYGGRFGLPTIQEPEFWMIMATVWGLLATVWAVCSRMLGGSPRWNWLLDREAFRPESAILSAAFLGWSMLVVIGLLEAVSHELFRDIDSGWVQLASYRTTLMISLAIMFGAIAVAGVFRKRESFLWWMALQFVWMVAWISVGIGFDATQSFATSTRWLASIGCVVSATMVLMGKGWFSSWGKQLPITGAQLTSVINTYLVQTVGVVLLISTWTVGRVLLTAAGADALGGPEPGSLLARIPKEISFGLPAGLITASLLMFAIAEKREWLATAGSAIYQYVVVLAIGMLFLSPHPKLATEWFVNILQVVSVGMSCYGLVWYRYRGQMKLGQVGSSERSRPKQIEIHTVINLVLVSSLAVLIYARTFAAPSVVGDWTNSVGGLLGWTSLVLASLQVWFVFGERTDLRDSRVSFLCGWAGLVVVAMAAASLDRYFATPWLGLRTIVLGCVILLGLQVGYHLFLRRDARQSQSKTLGSLSNGLIFVISSAVLAYSIRGGLLENGATSFYLVPIACVVLLTTWLGIATWTASTQVIALAGVASFTTLVTDVNLWGYTIEGGQSVSLMLAISLLISSVWSVAHVANAGRDCLGRRFLWLPNVIPWMAVVWVGLACVGEMLSSAFGGGINWLLNPCGWAVVVIAGMHLAVNTWHTGTRLQLLCKYMWSMTVPMLLLSGWLPQSEIPQESYFAIFGGMASLVVLAWGTVWQQRNRLVQLGKSWGVPAIDRKVSAAHSQLPVYAILIGLFVVGISVLYLLSHPAPTYRYLAAMAPAVWAIAMGALAVNPDTSPTPSRGWIQVLALSVLTGGAVLVSWAGLDAMELALFGGGAQLRLVMVLSAATFVYGIFVSRWVRDEDAWLVSLRTMMGATCVAAVLSIAGLIFKEWQLFSVDRTLGIELGAAIGCAVLVLGMVFGLIYVAVKPKRDPFSFSESGRMVYVYLAQIVLVFLLAHLYFSMPFLFQFGIKQYWPYPMMLIAFGGVGVAHGLRARQLEVLAQPLFNTAVMLPIFISMAVWMIDSKADPSLVLLVGGTLYLLLGYTQQSILSGALAIVLGNLALWTFYGKYSAFSFENHPQLWLIPPAFSVLIGGHVARDRFTPSQSAMLRYLCVAIIYISSTSEVFIEGIGEQLWPPVVLALLSLGGIVAGIAMQVRAYLYLGATFLLTAMVTMISHAHQQLGHVWPWWAFGVVLGILILVAFGLFEKKRNEMRAITGHLKQWEL